MTPLSTSRVDLHCHSTASAVSKLGVQRALGLPECATPPEEVYELAKRRGMDFVTITDHDTIDGALELAERHDDAFVSEELTAWFRGEPQAVHILCWGITIDDHERLQSLAGDVEAVANELRLRSIACALAHPFYAVEAPLLPRHRRRLAQLFAIWETRNGSRAPELNAPAVVYIETHGGTGVGGSDDHSGVDIGRTYTETPAARDWRTFLDFVVLGRADAARRAGQRREVDARRDGARHPRARPRRAATARRPSRTRGRVRDGAAAHARGRRPQRRHRHGPRPRGRARAAARVDGLGRARPHGGRAARAPAARGLQPCRPLPSRPALPRAQARRGGRADRHGGARRRGHRGRSDDALRRLPRGDPVRPGGGLPRPREGEARAPRRRAAARRARRRRGRRHARRHAHARRAARARRARASRSRSSAPTRTSTAGSARSRRSTSRSTPG